MLRQFLVFLVIFLFSLRVLAAGADIYHFKSEQDNQRFQQLTRELRCLVCQSQSLADSDAALAKDLRHKIYSFIQEGKSDEDIRTFLVSRYGQFILFSPPFKLSTLLLWGFPLLLLAGIGLVLFLVL